MGPSSAFADLRRLSDWFASYSPGSRAPLHVERIARRLGSIAVPMLGRELAARARGDERRDAARAMLAMLASDHDARARVIAELHVVASSNACDEGKVCAVGLLAELGERGAARFSDPRAIQRRSALALAAQLDQPGDVAAAAELMLHQLRHDDIVQLLTVMADSSPGAAGKIVAELTARLDVEQALRDRIAHLAAPLGLEASPAVLRRPPRPTHVTVLADAADERLVVFATRKLPGERRWRRWAVLIGATGTIDDCFHEEYVGADGDTAPIVAELVGDGYRVASHDLERARGLVAAAARHSTEPATCLTSAYYLGRDLLDLGEAHLGGRVHPHPTSATLGRAVELIAEGEPRGALSLLGRCDEASADVAAASAACLLATGRPADALPYLARALETEPDFALHHWNVAVAHHMLADEANCFQALRRFVHASATPTGLFADPEQPVRVALAERMLAEIERRARLAGTTMRPRRRKLRARKPR